MVIINKSVSVNDCVSDVFLAFKKRKHGSIRHTHPPCVFQSKHGYKSTQIRRIQPKITEKYRLTSIQTQQFQVIQQRTDSHLAGDRFWPRQTPTNGSTSSRHNSSWSGPLAWWSRWDRHATGRCCRRSCGLSSMTCTNMEKQKRRTWAQTPRLRGLSKSSERLGSPFCLKFVSPSSILGWRRHCLSMLT